MNKFMSVCREIEAPLGAYIRKLLPGQHEADDIVQEALFRLWIALESKRLQSNPRAYAFSIAHNLVMDAHRSHKREQTNSSSGAEQATIEQGDCLLREQIELALGELPQHYQRALWLRELEGLCYADIAKKMNANEGSVKIWIYRAKHKMRGLLNKDGEFVGARPSTVHTGAKAPEQGAAS
ncbi:MAG: RNA polymerase sigma factor [Candidatus Hydrogenedentes bacterium]|nr:RNA polymerase sigma factor [Candidatus Hydrogenedentota bacterium]